MSLINIIVSPQRSNFRPSFIPFRLFLYQRRPGFLFCMEKQGYSCFLESRIWLLFGSAPWNMTLTKTFCSMRGLLTNQWQSDHCFSVPKKTDFKNLLLLQSFIPHHVNFHSTWKQFLLVYTQVSVFWVYICCSLSSTPWLKNQLVEQKLQPWVAFRLAVFKTVSRLNSVTKNLSSPQNITTGFNKNFPYLFEVSRKILELLLSLSFCETCKLGTIPET